VVTVPSGYLLDTNVISELMKTRPARSVADWIVETPAVMA
jgi:predicted nucleic acid-binding protein